MRKFEIFIIFTDVVNLGLQLFIHTLSGKDVCDPSKLYKSVSYFSIKIQCIL